MTQSAFFFFFCLRSVFTQSAADHDNVAHTLVSRAMSESVHSNKCCSACGIDRPAVSYSGAQLKKKGQRVCKVCITRKELETEVELWSASTPTSTTTTITNMKCIMCKKQQDVSLRSCTKCASQCCSRACFHQHKQVQLCERLQRYPPPPLTIAKENIITPRDAAIHLQRLEGVIEEYVRGLPPHIADQFEAENFNFPHMSFDEPLILLQLYPPCDALWPWWVCDSVSAGICVKSANHLSTTMDDVDIQPFLTKFTCFVTKLTILYQVVTAPRGLHTVEESRMCLENGVQHEKTRTLSCPFEDDSRVFHRILTYLIYYYRFVDRSLLPESILRLLDVSSDRHGVMPQVVNVAENYWSGIAYCTSDSGILLPFCFSIPLVGWAMTRTCLSHKDYMLVFLDGRLQMDQCGFLVERSQPQHTFVVAVDAAFRVQPTWLTKPSDDILARAIQVAERELTITNRDEAERSRIVANSFFLVRTIENILGTEWPTVGRATFIPMPALGLEQEVVELLLLAELVDLANAGDELAQQTIVTLEKETGTSIDIMVHSQKTRLEQMLEDQRKQMAIHAQVVAHTEQRRQKPVSRVNASSAFSNAAASTAANTSSVVAASHSRNTNPAASSPSSATSPAWMSEACTAKLDALMSAGRLKFRHVKKLLLAVLKASPLQTNQTIQNGSHAVMHFDGASAPWTLVEQHAGNSKDTVVKRSVRTRMCSHLLSIVNSHMTQQQERKQQK